MSLGEEAIAKYYIHYRSDISQTYCISGIPHCVYLSLQIVLPPHLERIREKLAENIHELWAITRIEQGWTYGTVSILSLLQYSKQH